MIKNSLLIATFVGLFAVVVTSCGPNPKEANEYKMRIDSLQKAVVVAGNNVELAFESFDTVKIEQSLRHANLICENSLKQLRKVTPITRDSILYENTGAFFISFRKVLENEYQEKFNLYRIPDEQFTLENEKQVERLNTSKKQKLSKASQKLKDAEYEFAERFNLTVISK
ncbi:MAG: hypothetical protein U9N85_06085 [Bacteroidota bacterium]|nr:hypothetical protein [Bacteroidota bacterium]